MECYGKRMVFEATKPSGLTTYLTLRKPVTLGKSLNFSKLLFFCSKIEKVILPTSQWNLLCH